MANQLYMPNLVQTFNQGVDRGKQNRLAALAGQAYTVPTDRRRALLGEMASISPRAAALESTVFQKQDMSRQKKLAGAATYMLRAHQSGNPQAVEGAYRAVRPFLAETSGQEPPEQFDPAMWPMIYRIAAANGAKFDMNPNSPAAVQAFEYFAKDLTPEQMQRARMVHLGLAPRAGQPRLSNGYQVTQTPNGPVAQQIPIVGAGQSFTEAGTNGHDVSFNFAPGTPQGVIDAARAVASANGDTAPSSHSGVKTLAEVAGSHGSSGDVVNRRGREIEELNARGVKLTPTQEQAYMLTGHVPAAMLGGDNGQQMSDDAAYYAAWNYNLTGKMPPFGMGGSSARIKVYNEAAQIARKAGVSPAEMRTVQGRQKALQSSLTNLRKQSDIMQKQMEAMHNNMDVAEQIIRQVDNGNIKSMNALRNAVRGQLGNAAVARLNTAVNAVATDYGKIMSGATGAAGANEGELQQARKLIDPNMSPAQILGVFDVLRKDSEGQIHAANSRQAAIEDLMGQFGTGGDVHPAQSDVSGSQPVAMPQNAPTSDIDAALRSVGVQ